MSYSLQLNKYIILIRVWNIISRTAHIAHFYPEQTKLCTTMHFENSYNSHISVEVF